MNENKAVIAQLNEDEREIYNHLSDKRWRLNNLYKIIDDAGNVITFNFNTFQERLFDELWYLNIILKARQHGITTFVTLYILDSVLFENNKNSLIIAHTVEDAEVIFRNKIKFAFDNLPEWLRKHFKASTENVRELIFDNGSSIRVATSGRSGTFQYLHITEFGIMCQKYPEKAKEIISGSLNAVHKGQMVFIEATAKGSDGKFYDMCQTAIRNKDRGVTLTPLDYKFFFFPWWENKKYQLSVNFDIHKDLQNYFSSLIPLGITLTKEQQNWYAKKYETQNYEMLSEYPSTADEAFSYSANTLFSKESIVSLRDKLQSGKTKGDWTIYDEPVRGHTYVLGADVAEGVGQDSSTVVIWDLSTLRPRIVAEYKNNRIPPDMFAYEIKNMATAYSMALAAVERNNHGHTTLAKLKEIYPVHCIYKDPLNDRLGWQTNVVSKPKMMFDFNNAVNNGLVDIPSKTILHEMMNYNQEDISVTKFDPESTRHWDLLIAAVIGFMMRLERKDRAVARQWRPAFLSK